MKKNFLKMTALVLNCAFIGTETFCMKVPLFEHPDLTKAKADLRSVVGQHACDRICEYMTPQWSNDDFFVPGVGRDSLLLGIQASTGVQMDKFKEEKNFSILTTVLRAQRNYGGTMGLPADFGGDGSGLATWITELRREKEGLSQGAAALKRDLREAEEKLRGYVARAEASEAEIARLKDQLALAAAESEADAVKDQLTRDVSSLNDALEKAKKAKDTLKEEKAALEEERQAQLTKYAELQKEFAAAREALITATQEAQDFRALRDEHNTLLAEHDQIRKELEAAVAAQSAQSAGTAATGVSEFLTLFDSKFADFRGDLMLKLGTLDSGREAEYEARLEALRAEHEAEIAKMEEEHRFALSGVRTLLQDAEMSVAGMKKSQENVGEALQELEHTKAALQSELDTVRLTLETTRREAGAMMDQMGTEHASKMKALNEELAQLRIQNAKLQRMVAAAAEMAETA
ncbi:MAG: hypothetical protein LBF54_01595 [Holosporaceae bacterium]|nr:hypothetical protein [Holosporaceae bacterium]